MSSTTKSDGDLYVPLGCRFTYRMRGKKVLVSAVHKPSGLKVHAMGDDYDEVRAHARRLLLDGVAKLGLVPA